MPQPLWKTVSKASTGWHDPGKSQSCERCPMQQPKPGSGFGIRLDQSQAPLASSVSDTTGRTQHFLRRRRDLNRAVVKSARQLFHSGLLITTPCPDWLLQNRSEGTNTNHFFDSLHWAKQKTSELAFSHSFLSWSSLLWFNVRCSEEF